MLKATVQFFIRIEAPAKLAERILRMLFSSDVKGPGFRSANLKSEAVFMEELMLISKISLTGKMLNEYEKWCRNAPLYLEWYTSGQY